MAEIKKEGGAKRFKIEDVGFSFADVKKEEDFGISRVKTEENLLNDCDVASMIQQVNSFETKLTAVKQEYSDKDNTNGNNVTGYLLIPETILPDKTEDDVQDDDENQVANCSSVHSDESLAHSMWSETREDGIHSSVISYLVAENFSKQSIPFESIERQKEKQKQATEFLNLKSFTTQSSTTGLSEIAVGQQDTVGSMNKGMGNEKSNEVSVINVESSVPKMSTTGLKKGNRKPKPIKEKIVCPFCDKSMAKNYFPYHARVHTDEKPFKCSKCSYRSHFKGTLDFHVESHHPTKGYIKPKP